MLNLKFKLCHHINSSLSGSDVRYDDSMNLRNILWLAPLPGNSNKGWVAPGTATSRCIKQEAETLDSISIYYLLIVFTVYSVIWSMYSKYSLVRL